MAAAPARRRDDGTSPAVAADPEAYGRRTGRRPPPATATWKALLPAETDQALVSEWLQREREVAEEAGELSSLFDDDDDDDDDDGRRETATPCEPGELEVWELTVDSGTPVLFSRCCGASAFGHGDEVWASALLLARALLDPSLAASQLGLSGLMTNTAQGDGGERKHLEGLRVLELGAGVGLPSWASFHAGALQVIVTDAPFGGRLFTMASSAALNSCRLRPPAAANTAPIIASDPNLEHGRAACAVYGHMWGADSAQSLRTRLGGEPLDVVIASDCIYNPEGHGALLESAAALLKPRGGRLLVAFSLHGNVQDADVLSFFEKASAAGLTVVHTYEEQLPLRCGNMPASRSYVQIKTLAKL